MSLNNREERCPDTEAATADRVIIYVGPVYFPYEPTWIRPNADENADRVNVYVFMASALLVFQ